MKALQREDEAHTFRIDVALRKAWAAGAMGESSRIVLQNARENPPFYNAMAATADGKFLPQTGAVLIRDAKGKVLGSAGL